MEWTWIDISSYVMGNSVFPVLGFIFSVLFAGVVGAAMDEGGVSHRTIGTAFISVIVIGLLLALVVGLAPTHDRILELKISKIKNEAVTKENLDKGVDVIERVVEKLSNKYLGGCDEE